MMRGAVKNEAATTTISAISIAEPKAIAGRDAPQAVAGVASYAHRLSMKMVPPFCVRARLLSHGLYRIRSRAIWRSQLRRMA